MAPTETEELTKEIKELIERGSCAEALEKAAKAAASVETSRPGDVVDIVQLMVAAHHAEANINGDKSEKAEALAKGELAKYRAKGDKRGEAVMLFALAETSVGQMSLATRKRGLDWANDSIKIAKELQDKPLQLKVLLTLILIQYEAKHSSEVLRVATEALDLSKSLDDKSGQVSAMHGIALATFMDGDLDLATSKGLEAVAMCKENGMKQKQAEQLTMLAHMRLKGSKDTQALTLAKEAMELYRQFEVPQAGEFRALDVAVKTLLQRKQARKAVKLAQTSLERFQASGDKKASLNILGIIAQCYFEDEDAKRALQVAQDAVALAKELEDRRWEMDNMFLVAEAHFLKEDSFDSGIAALDKALAIAKAIGDKQGQARVLKTKVQLYHNMKETSKVLPLVEEALPLCQAVDDLAGEGSLLLVSCNARAREGDVDGGLEDAVEAREVFEEAGETTNVAYTLGVIAELYLAKKKLRPAMQAAEASLDIFHDLGNTNEEIKATLLISSIQRAWEEPEKAIAAAEAAVELARTMNDKQVQANSLISVVDILHSTIKDEDEDKDTIEKAAKIAHEAVLLAGKSENKALRASALFWRGHVSLWEDKLQHAFDDAYEAEQIFKAEGDVGGEAMALSLTALVYLQSGEDDVAKDTAEKAVALAKTGEDRTAEKNCDLVLSKVEERRASKRAAPSPQALQQYGGDDGDLPAAAAAAPKAPEKVALDAGAVTTKVMELVKNVLAGDDGIETDSALMEAGVDSLSSVQLTGDLSREFGMPMSPSLMFDFPTVRNLADHIVERSSS